MLAGKVACLAGRGLAEGGLAGVHVGWGFGWRLAGGLAGGGFGWFRLGGFLEIQSCWFPEK